ncbi:unnamed protein product [Rotaria magnacalcarata]|uniref:Phosphoinositide phospholipase C n=1 Tax=Rotaria magnacalcarata TaxID=392030 RepID=A0A8S2PY54_9BILA|nr:unnamed protein product [Rotaria magnacalcarata]
MNGESNKEEDIDENNISNVCSSSNSTTSSVSCRSASVSTENFLRKHQQISRRRAFFHDGLIAKSNKNNNASNENNNNNNHSLIMDGSQQILTTNNENDGLSNDEIPTIIANTNEETHTNKPLKRKVVSFSTMPFEKKVADDLEDRQQMRDRWLRDAFAVGLPSPTGDSEHLNQNDDRRISTLNSIDEEEAIRLLIDYGIAEDKAKVRLQEVQMTKSEDARGYFTTEELVSAFKELSTRPEIYHLLVRYSRNQDFLSTEDLTLFLEAEQGMSKVTREKCADIIHEFEPSTEAKVLGHLGIDGFTNYLLSPECDIFNPNNRSICQEMNHPLNHYFIASSHNTFLLADQLKGPSSVDGFIHALMRGCRCLELHCFDGPDGQPLIHNGTLTSRIPLSEALEAINNYAFETSSYPLILCLELHCGISQQERIAQLLLETFSDKLYLDNSSMDAKTTFNEYRPLPSPNDLRGRIIIKSKKIPQSYLNDNTRDYGEITDDEDCYEDNRRRSKKVSKMISVI